MRFMRFMRIKGAGGYEKPLSERQKKCAKSVKSVKRLWRKRKAIASAAGNAAH